MTQEYYSADVAHKYAEEIIAAQMSNPLKEVFAILVIFAFSD